MGKGSSEVDAVAAVKSRGPGKLVLKKPLGGPLVAGMDKKKKKKGASVEVAPATKSAEALLDARVRLLISCDDFFECV
jgi:hypothetical protein